MSPLQGTRGAVARRYASVLLEKQDVSSKQEARTSEVKMVRSCEK